MNLLQKINTFAIRHAIDIFIWQHSAEFLEHLILLRNQECVNQGWCCFSHMTTHICSWVFTGKALILDFIIYLRPFEGMVDN